MRHNAIRRRLSRISDLSAASMPRQTLVEILDICRVIIENHKGVCLYTKEQICINAYYGTVIVYGNNLEIAKMSNDQLVIIGDIHSVCMERVCKA